MGKSVFWDLPTAARCHIPGAVLLPSLPRNAVLLWTGTTSLCVFSDLFGNNPLEFWLYHTRFLTRLPDIMIAVLL
jgi:hypothetical protein